MGYDRIKQILGVAIMHVTGDQIGKLVSECKGLKSAFKRLPKYVLTDKGKITEAKYWLQYVFEGKEPYILFDYAYADGHLSEFISNVGLEEMFDKHNLLPLFSKLQYISYEHRAFPITSRLVCDVIYSSSFTGEFTEYDSEFELMGYMDENLNINGSLFTTYDGVDMFAPDQEVFAVMVPIDNEYGGKIDTGKWDVHGVLVALQERAGDEYRWFSSIEARQKYMDS